MAGPRLDTTELGPDFGHDDSDDGLLSRFDADADHWQFCKRLLLPTPTFTTLFVYGSITQVVVFCFAFLGFAVHSAFLAPAMVLFTLAYPVGFLAVVVVIAYKAMNR
jgi:hypothetical protein